MHIYRPQTKLRERNFFTGVCQSTGITTPLSPGQPPTPGKRLLPNRNLMATTAACGTHPTECILVHNTAIQFIDTLQSIVVLTRKHSIRMIAGRLPNRTYCIMSKFEHIREGVVVWSLYGEVQCIMGNGHTWGPPLPRGQTHTTENINNDVPNYNLSILFCVT